MASSSSDSSSDSSSSLSSSSNSSSSSSSQSSSSSSSTSSIEYSSWSSSSESSSSSSFDDFPDSYVTYSEIVEFMREVNSNFGNNDINETIVGASYDYINNRLGTEFERESATLYLDGRGEPVIYSSKIPIDSLSSVTIIYQSGTETELTLSGTSKNCWYDPTTGRIWTDLDNEGNIEVNLESKIFPDRPRSVKVVGVFGTYSSALVKYVQLLLILKHYALLNPKTYAKGDMVSETIGRYSYKLDSGINTADPSMQRKGLDAYIEWYFKQISKEDSWGYEAI